MLLVNDVTVDTFLVKAPDINLADFLVEQFSPFLIKADKGLLTLLKREGTSEISIPMC